MVSGTFSRKILALLHDTEKIFIMRRFSVQPRAEVRAVHRMINHPATSTRLALPITEYYPSFLANKMVPLHPQSADNGSLRLRCTRQSTFAPCGTAPCRCARYDAGVGLALPLRATGPPKKGTASRPPTSRVVIGGLGFTISP